MVRLFAMKIAGLDELPRNLQEKQRSRSAQILLNKSLEKVDRTIELPVKYSRNRYGKPYLTDYPKIYVNWSHSGEYILCGVADCEIGVDLQYNKKEPKESLVRRTLDASELEHYQGIPEKERQSCFYEYWTLKESFLKALGTGFHTSLKTFSVLMGQEEGPVICQNVNEKRYHCAVLDFADPDYTAAVCCETELETMEVEYL